MLQLLSRETYRNAAFAEGHLECSCSPSRHCCTLLGPGAAAPSWEVTGSPRPQSHSEQRCHGPEDPALVPHGTRPHQQRNKEKSHPKILQTSWSLQNPAINRPLIGHCNGIQFISTSDGLTFIITRGSTCHELWAIHSLVEINCITSAQHRVLCTAHTDGQQLFASAVRTRFLPHWCRILLWGATRQLFDRTGP